MADESGKLEPQELQQLTLRKQKPYLFPLARRARLYTPSPLRHEITRESYLPSTSDLDPNLVLTRTKSERLLRKNRELYAENKALFKKMSFALRRYDELEKIIGTSTDKVFSELCRLRRVAEELSAEKDTALSEAWQAQEDNVRLRKELSEARSELNEARETAHNERMKLHNERMKIQDERLKAQDERLKAQPELHKLRMELIDLKLRHQ